MTLTEIRALPQKLVEAFDRYYAEREGEAFEVESATLVCWMRGARGLPVPSDNPEDQWHKDWSAGYAYWLGKRGEDP